MKFWCFGLEKETSVRVEDSLKKTRSSVVVSFSVVWTRSLKTKILVSWVVGIFGGKLG